MNWRRNVASLSKAELLRFTTAVNALKNNGAQGNKYDELVLWHHAAAYKDTPENQVTPPKVPTRAVAHTGPSFFPWHSYFIRRFELELQQVVNGTGITLPYWNWTEDSSNIPENMAVWNKDCMGGTGDDTDYFVVKTGPFQRWPIVRTEVGPLQQWESPDNKLTRNLGGSGYPLPTSAEVSNASKDNQL
ncbi:MAG TPA: tyrosinase family protein [Nitrososphaeraceae archaeon]